MYSNKVKIVAVSNLYYRDFSDIKLSYGEKDVKSVISVSRDVKRVRRIWHLSNKM